METPDIQFDEQRHEYRVAGEVWPGVTQVLAPMQCFLEGIPQDALEAAGAFGSNVHRACHLDNQGALDWETLDPALRPYVLAWREFVRARPATIIASELRVAHRRLKYCGTLDALALIDGERWLLDIKTSASIPPTAGPQTRAYAEALGQPRIRRAVIQLRADGSYRFARLTDPADWSHFLSALNLYRWREKYGAAA